MLKYFCPLNIYIHNPDCIEEEYYYYHRTTNIVNHKNNSVDVEQTKLGY